MEKIKKFIFDLVQAEQNAHAEYRKRDNMSGYNDAFDYLMSFTHDVSDDAPAIGFGVGRMSKPDDEVFFEELFLMLEIRPRHLYKISHYENSKYSDLWACYMSIANPYNDIPRFDDCFIVAEVNGELKIVAKFGRDIDQPKWKHYGGDRKLKMSALGKLIAIERMREPGNDPWSIKQYNKEI